MLGAGVAYQTLGMVSRAREPVRMNPCVDEFRIIRAWVHVVSAMLAVSDMTGRGFARAGIPIADAGTSVYL